MMGVKNLISILLLGLVLGGCALSPASKLRYQVKVEPVLPEGGAYYVDPIDSSVVWSQEGLQVKVKFYDDAMLDAEFPPKTSPYTLTGWKPISPFTGPDYTPPLWTVFEVTVINRTLDRVELDPTQVVLRLDNGNYYYCSQGVGVYQEAPHYFNYYYLKWSSREGRVHYYASYDVAQNWARSIYLREKPVAKGKRYTGKLTFPPLPPETRSVTLEINNFIMAFDRFEVGYGNPTEFMNLEFRFDVNQGVVVAGGR
jgi:hypothetical protein